MSPGRRRRPPGMTALIVDITVSLGGYVAGPGAGPDNGLGDGGEALHDWVVAQPDSPVDAAQLSTMFERTGAVVMGRRLFDVIDGPHGWADDRGYGYDQDQSKAPHNVVVTHAPPERPRHTSGFTYVDGIAEAVAVAREHAGDRDVVVMGGADVCGQVLAAGLADELRLHIAPIVLGGGAPLFSWATGPVRFEQVEAVVSPHAVHAVYRPRGA